MKRTVTLTLLAAVLSLAFIGFASAADCTCGKSVEVDPTSQYNDSP